MQNGRFQSAGVLAILAIEEQGKLSILDRMAYAKDAEITSLWAEYRSHTKKNFRWLLPAVADSGPRTLEEFASIAHPNSPFPGFLDEIKQMGLYADCLEGGEWSKPEDHISEEFARWLIDTASRLIGSKRNPFKAEDIALRAKHFSPILDASPEEKKRALAAYLKEARGKGFTVIDDKTIEEMLGGRIDMRGVGSS